MEKLVEMVAAYSEPPMATAERYRRVAAQMLKGNKHIGSLGGFSEARAALVHHAISTAKAIFETPVETRTPEMLNALADVEKFLSFFPVGGAGLTYSGKRTTKSERKKRTRGLAPNWRDTVFDVVKDCFPNDAAAVAVLELAGLRRAELATGVRVQRCAEGLTLWIQGAKVNPLRGQPQRTLVISLTHPRAAWLSRGLHFSTSGFAKVQVNKHHLNYVITACAREAFPSLPDSLLPTPKTYRDQLSADLKKFCSALDVATVLGHLSERSQSAYAGPRYARGGVDWIVTASVSRDVKPFKGVGPFGLQQNHVSEVSCPV